ncbi:MAG: ABC transporter substrate-binding protein [Betaproteobacteria bacterium]
MRGVRVRLFCGLLAGVLAMGVSAEPKYDSGASDSEIRIGQTMAYTGPASAYGTIGRAQAAYFQMVNEHGGINGRRVTLITLDDGYNPARTLEQTRLLVEGHRVLAIFQSLGTATNAAVQRYLNTRKIPQLFVSTGASKWGDPTNFPWTMGWQPSYQVESAVYAKYILQTKPDAKIAVLYQNDDYGNDYLLNLKAGLGAKAGMVVMEASYGVTDDSVDAQIVALRASGADTLFIFATPKFAAQAIAGTYDIGWKPLQFVNNVSSSITSVLQPAGLDKAVDLITSAYLKEPTDPQWSKDKALKDWLEWMKQYYPQGDLADTFNVYGFAAAQTLAYVLKQCGNDLTRENVMRQASAIRNLELPLLLPGIRLNTSATDYFPIKQLQLARFDGKRWVPFGDVLTTTSK